MRSAIRGLCALVATCPSLLLAQELRLPSAERLFVMQGGDTPNVNYHMAYPSQAFAVDLVVVGGAAGNELTHGDPKRLESYYGFGTGVVAPVSGTIIELENGLPDNPIGTHDTQHAFGNHVIIQSGNHFYYLAHFQRGSVSVNSGDRVAAGQPIARCGNSGNSDVPHIHMHMTRSPRSYEGVGENMTFAHMNVELSGKQFTDVEWPLIRGLFVEQRR
jgi:hypothetical protein